MFALPLMMVGNSSGGGGTIPTPYVDIPFTTDYSDVSGNGHPVTNNIGTSIVTDVTFPRSGGKVLLASTSGYGVDIDYHSISDFGNIHTYSFWGKPTSQVGQFDFFYAGWVGDIEIRNFDGSNFIFNTPYFSKTQSGSINIWHHFCISIDRNYGGVVSYYLNGQKIDSKIPISYPQSSFFFSLHTGGDSSLTYYSRFRVWKQLLTDEEVLAEYNRA